MRRALAALPGLLAAGAMTFGSVGVAEAETAASAHAEAEKIAAQVAALQPQVDDALASYDAALDGVARSVSVSVADRRTYTALKAQADAASTAHAARVVALYEAGGGLAIYGSVFTSGEPASLRQLPYISVVVGQQGQRAETLDRLAAAAKARLDADKLAITTGLDSADVVNQRVQQLDALLAQQQQLLDAASAKASQLQALQDAAARLAAERAAAAQVGAQAADRATPQAIPPAYRALYQAAAATCPGLSWTVLAAIGQVETHHGQGSMVSSAGALGPMQFLPATFAHYAVDGDHNGVADIRDPADAIFTAARYLCANGAGQGSQGLYAALWNYNHADWYVQLVLAIAAKLS